MQKNHESRSGGEHKKVKRAAEIGAVGLGLAGAGAAAVYYARKRRTKNLQTYDAETTSERNMQEKADIFNEPRLSEERRKLMAEAAVRIHYATADTSYVIEPKILRGLLGEHVRRHEFQTAISYLRDNGLIETTYADDGSKRRGYQATPALDWAINYGDYPVLADAGAEMLGQVLNEGYSSD